MKLEIGCGDKKPKQGFVGVDVRKFEHVKYVCNAWELSSYIKPKTVEEIYSRHFFEHLTYHQADETLKTWNTILKINARINLIVPDLDYHCRQLINKDKLFEPTEMTPALHNAQHALYSIFGWQNESEAGEVWDIHKSGYNFELLKLKLESFGFSDIRRLDDFPFNLNVEALKTKDFSEIKEIKFEKNFKSKTHEELEIDKSKLEEIKKEYKGKKIVIYGAGQLAKKLLNENYLEGLNIVAVFDGDKQKENSSINGISIFHRDQVTRIEFDAIIISVMYYWDIWQFLSEKISADKIKLIFFNPVSK